MRYPATPFKFTLIALFMLCGQALQAQPFDGLSEAIGQGAFGSLTTCTRFSRLPRA